MQVIGAAQARGPVPDTVVMCAAGTMPGELHKLWKAGRPRSLPHGIRLLLHGPTSWPGPWRSRWPSPKRDVVCMLGDGSYMMMNSELATARDDGIKDHRRDHRQPRLPAASTGCRWPPRGREFKQPCWTTQTVHAAPSPIDFAAHGRKHGGRGGEGRLPSPSWSRRWRRRSTRRVPFVRRDRHGPLSLHPPSAGIGGRSRSPRVSPRAEVNEARKGYESNRKRQVTHDPLRHEPHRWSNDDDPTIGGHISPRDLSRPDRRDRLRRDRGTATSSPKGLRSPQGGT